MQCPYCKEEIKVGSVKQESQKISLGYKIGAILILLSICFPLSTYFLSSIDTRSYNRIINFFYYTKSDGTISYLKYNAVVAISIIVLFIGIGMIIIIALNNYNRKGNLK